MKTLNTPATALAVLAQERPKAGLRAKMRTALPNTMKRLKRFGRDEDGNMAMEFVLGLPLIFTLFMTSVEMGIYSMRQMFLDRGLDIAVRNIRLHTGAGYTHADIKLMICTSAGFLKECDTNLRLSMNPVDIRSFNGFGGPADCTDASQPIAPLQAFQHGLDHKMMLMRACYMFKPVFPTSGLGYALTKDGSGRSKMVSLTAFVQEPQ